VLDGSPARWNPMSEEGNLSTAQEWWQGGNLLAKIATYGVNSLTQFMDGA
jgi:hypothetical protein